MWRPDALAYILKSSDTALLGMMKLLRVIAPDLPMLRFKTQQSEGGIRPDMWGYADDQPRVFIENKFWAGLTDNQPVSYIRQLAEYQQPTVLLVIAPAAREQALWRELCRRLDAEGVGYKDHIAGGAVGCSAVTSTGAILALTSWGSVLSVLENECIDSPTAKADITQLKGLCDSADADAFAPVSRAEVTDQRLPAFVIQLGSIVQAAAELAFTRQIISLRDLRPQASWNRIGRYVRFPCEASESGAGAWFGIDFNFWKTYGATPLWLIFHDTQFGRGQEVQSLIEPWAIQNDILTVDGDGYTAIALEMPTGEERDEVIRSLAAEIERIAGVLAQLPPKEGAAPLEEFT